MSPENRRSWHGRKSTFVIGLGREWNGSGEDRERRQRDDLSAGARIVSFDQAPVREMAYEDLEHVVLTRDFLKDSESFLRRL